MSSIRQSSISKFQNAYQHCIDSFNAGEAVWMSNPYPYDADSAAGWDRALKVCNRRVKDVMEFYGTNNRREK